MKNETFLSGEYEHLPNTWDEMFDENGKIRKNIFSQKSKNNVDQQGLVYDIKTDMFVPVKNKK